MWAALRGLVGNIGGMRYSSKRSFWLAALSVLLVGLVVLMAMAAALAPSLLPVGDRIGSEGRSVAAGLVFVGSYFALAIGRIPGLSIDRAGIALVGAGLMVASGALPLEDAYKAIDLDTITLLLGMMIVVANLRLSGFFALANAWVMVHARRPLILLGAVVATSGFFSAFLVNDAICLVLTPLVLELTVALGRRPVPYLLAVAMASNVGSTATITGNPQNIMIGSLSHIPYTKFAFALGPIALIGLIVTVALIAIFHRAEFAGAVRLEAPPPKVNANRVLMIRALLATLIMIVLFFAGVVPAKAAIIIGGLLLLTRRMKSRRVYEEIDWSLLLMFAGLFVIVAGAQHALLSPDIVTAVGRLHLDRVPVLTAVTAVLSNLVSNVPAVLMLKPFVDALKDHDTAWLVIAMASTLAGNFTVLGSIANLIVVQRAAGSGVAISFWDYFRVGAPLTIVTLVIGTLWLWL
jgi:Na+/H+ antiporter NhaD/arsenite permease-like protein